MSNDQYKKRYLNNENLKLNKIITQNVLIAEVQTANG
jgi:hypothetical protein